MPSHHILGGRVQVYQRKGSRFWQCSASIKGDQHRATTGLEDVRAADKFAEEWYLRILAGDLAGTLKKPSERTFRQAATVFLEEYKASVEGQQSPAWINGHEYRLRLHLTPFFGDQPLSRINSGSGQDYRIHRAGQKIIRPGQTEETAQGPALSTIHDEIVTLRMVLKCALRREWISHLPDLSPPYRANGKVVARPWFSPAEYKQLYEATRAYAKNPPLERFRWNAEQVHDFGPREFFMPIINDVADFNQPLQWRLMLGLEFAIAALNDAGDFLTRIPDPNEDSCLSREDVLCRLRPLLVEARSLWEREERFASCFPSLDE